MTPNQAAAQAIQLFSEDARLCERHPNKIPRTQSGNVLSEKITSSVVTQKNYINSPSNEVNCSKESCGKSNIKNDSKEGMH